MKNYDSILTVDRLMSGNCENGLKELRGKFRFFSQTILIFYFRRIQEGAQFAAKMENAKRYNQKLEKQLKSLKKYLSELPTRDEYKTLLSEKSRLLESSNFMEKEMATIKEKLKSYTVSVDKMGRDKAELAHELDLARQRIQGQPAHISLKVGKTYKVVSLNQNLKIGQNQLIIQKLQNKYELNVPN